jgi:glutaredoxin
LARIRIFLAEECHLCEAALEVLEVARSEIGFSLEVVDIGGDEGLEARYRERIPVVEIDGEEAFTYFVQPDVLRERLLRRPEGGVGTM